ncbi:MAG: P1 family peptidase [Acidobacteria bacterium]|nr:P1 family peptidase [Acidobacteriota bacterium]
MDRRTFIKLGAVGALGEAQARQRAALSNERPGGPRSASAAARGLKNRPPLQVRMEGFITDVDGIKVGHFTDTRRPTGCTVILYEKGAVAGVDVRGSAPGTRETDLLDPSNLVQQVHAILLTGGSAYGLDAASGVMRWLEEHNAGFRIGSGVVPIVPAAVLFDLNVGDGKIRPNAESGYKACQQAKSGPIEEGTVGAGAGATIGKSGGGRPMKGGIGTSSIKLTNGLVVGAIVAVNCIGNIIDPKTGKIIAGARKPDGTGFQDIIEGYRSGLGVERLGEPGENTTIGVVATNASFSKAEMKKIAQMAHDGMARAISPIHTMVDGDALFAMSTSLSTIRADINAIGALAAETVSEAILRAVKKAKSVPGYPSYEEISSGR